MSDGGGGGRVTYRTLDEQAGRLSDAEERFERKRRTAGLFLAPAVFLLLLAVPLGLTRPQQNLAAILGLVLVLWISEAIPIPVSGIVGVCLCVMLQVTDKPDDIFASFSNSTVFLFIGSFIIAEAMLVHQLDRRLAFTVLSMRFVGNSTYPDHPRLRADRGDDVAVHVEHRCGGDDAAHRHRGHDQRRGRSSASAAPAPTTPGGSASDPR